LFISYSPGSIIIDGSKWNFTLHWTNWMECASYFFTIFLILSSQSHLGLLPCTVFGKSTIRSQDTTTTTLPDWGLSQIPHPDKYSSRPLPSTRYVDGWDCVSVSLVHPPDYIWVWRATVEWYWQEKTEELGEKPFPVPLCPSQFPHELTENTNRLSHDTTFPSTTFQVHHSQSSTIRHFVTSTLEKSSHKSTLSFTWSCVNT
jgi:hypothetical protein